jgi:hypothetical protein
MSVKPQWKVAFPGLAQVSANEPQHAFRSMSASEDVPQMALNGLMWRVAFGSLARSSFAFQRNQIMMD